MIQAELIRELRQDLRHWNASRNVGIILMRAQKDMRILLETELEAILITPWNDWSALLPYPDTSKRLNLKVVD